MLKTPDAPAGLRLRRVLGLFLAITVIFGIFFIRLFQVQILQGEQYASLADASTQTSISIAASRGEILDRNQIPLVSNRTSYAVVLDYNYFPHGSAEEQQKAENDCILRLVSLLRERGEEWADSLPISEQLPYSYEQDRDVGISKLHSYLRMASYATAENCMDQMTEKFCLQSYSDEERRSVAGIRYEMICAGFNQSTPYVFANDISSDTMYRILENSSDYPGVDVITVPVRQYESGTVGCHIIGSVGPIYAEEYAELKEKGYSYNDTVGKSGIESAAESDLRGTNGKRVLVKNSSGTVISEKETQAPIPGKTVILSLDSKLQQTAQDVLDAKIASLRATAAVNNGRDVKSGAAVVLDVKNGGVMVCASSPGYDLSTYTENYTELVNDPDNPLFNRALYGSYPCGSVFKPGMALAALTEGKISPSTSIRCTLRYTYYAPSYTPKCMGLHGALNVVTALQKSCNFFFYDVGRVMGDSIFPYLNKYGFGQKTGVEIGESAGIQHDPEYLQSVGQTWVPGDYLQLAIGQRGAYTPIQLASYVMMIANNGVRYKTHFIQAYREYDSSSDTVVKPEVAATVEWTDSAMKTVKQGMIAVGKSGTARSYFASTPYTVACKTGTAQTGLSTGSDHGTFIAYAPADNPEVAVAVVLERGTSGAASHVARQILDAYFSTKETGEAPTGQNVLLP